MRKNILIPIFIAGLFVLASCNKYLNVVPDDVATIDNAFALRSAAEKFLFTCYSYMPSQGSTGSNPAFFGGDELWLVPTASSAPWEIARGNQRVVEPYCNYWQGTQEGSDLYEGIRQCNILLENIEKVPDMQESEKARWSAEAK